MFNDIFSQLLQEKKIKPYHLSKGIGISSGLVSDYVNGKKSPTVENLVKIADFLDVSVDFLLGRTSNPEVNHSEKEKAPDLIRSTIVERVAGLSDHQADLLLAFLEGLQAE